MYRVEEEKIFVEGEEVTLYGVGDENRFYCGFTRSRQIAADFADLLNNNGVEACHVADIIEDMFYSG